MSETEETFRHCPPPMPADGPHTKYDSYMDDVEKIDYLEMEALIADFLVHAITGPLGNGDCECGKSETTHGNRFFK